MGDHLQASSSLQFLDSPPQSSQYQSSILRRLAVQQSTKSALTSPHTAPLSQQTMLAMFTAKRCFRSLQQSQNCWHRFRQSDYRSPPLFLLLAAVQLLLRSRHPKSICLCYSQGRPLHQVPNNQREAWDNHELPLIYAERHSFSLTFVFYLAAFAITLLVLSSNSSVHVCTAWLLKTLCYLQLPQKNPRSSLRKLLSPDQS